MKTAIEWITQECKNKGIPVSFPSEDVDFINAIQKDALSDPFANVSDQQELEMARSIAYNERIRADQLHDQLLKMRAKWHETRRYLRSANKGAERNNMVMRLQAETIHNLLAKLKKP